MKLLLSETRMQLAVAIFLAMIAGAIWTDMGFSSWELTSRS